MGMTLALIIWAVGALLAWAFIYGATKRPSIPPPKERNDTE